MKSGKAELATLNKSINNAISELGKLESDHNNHCDVYTSEIEKLEREKQVLVQTNSDLNTLNISLESAITVSKTALEELTTEEINLKGAISSLKTEGANLLYKQTSILDQIEAKRTDLSILSDEFEVQKTASEKELSILEHKRQDLANEIVENRAQDDKVRENLALWQKKLEDQDSNLRVREGRVNQQEQSVARNYNLLQL